MPTQHTPTISSVRLADGTYRVHDSARDRTFRMTKHALADYIRKHARSEQHVPLGDYIHSVFSAAGVTGCLSCAERQAKMNRVLRRKGRMR